MQISLYFTPDLETYQTWFHSSGSLPSAVLRELSSLFPQPFPQSCTNKEIDTPSYAKATTILLNFANLMLSYDFF